MSRLVMPMTVGMDFNATDPSKIKENLEKKVNRRSEAAYGIVFGLLCSLIAWMFLAFGIYRIHALFIAVR
jgi:hypothetical protein